MIEVPIEYIRPGDVLGKNHTFRRYTGGMSSSVNLLKGYKLTGKVLEKLKRDYRVEYLCILDSVEGLNGDGYMPGFDENVRQAIVGNLRECVSAIETDKIIDLRQLRNVVRDILENVAAAVKNGGGSFRALSTAFHEVKSHDMYTWEHSVNSAIYAAVIALSVPSVLDETKRPNSPATFSKPEILIFNLLLHDIGKIRIPLSLLNKTEELTQAEVKSITKHPYDGFVYMRKINENLQKRHLPTIPAYFMRACLFHHQAYNGTGYPALRTPEDELEPLAGSDIPIVGRIASVADVYDALTSNRPYRLPFHPVDAFRKLMTERGKKLDPNITNVLLKRIVPFPKGSTVVLSNGDLAIVTGYADGNRFRPVVLPFLRKTWQGGKEHIIRLGNRDRVAITPSSKLKIVLNKSLYEVRKELYP